MESEGYQKSALFGHDLTETCSGSFDGALRLCALGLGEKRGDFFSALFYLKCKAVWGSEGLVLCSSSSSTR